MTFLLYSLRFLVILSAVLLGVVVAMSVQSPRP